MSSYFSGSLSFREETLDPFENQITPNAPLPRQSQIDITTKRGGLRGLLVLLLHSVSGEFM